MVSRAYLKNAPSRDVIHPDDLRLVVIVEVRLEITHRPAPPRDRQAFVKRVAEHDVRHVVNHHRDDIVALHVSGVA